MADIRVDLSIKMLKTRGGVLYNTRTNGVFIQGSLMLDYLKIDLKIVFGNVYSPALFTNLILEKSHDY